MSTTTFNHDVVAIIKSLKLIADPEGVFEVRALDVKQRYGAPKMMSGYWRYSQIDDAAKAITGLDSGSIYMTVNPPIDRLLAKRNSRLAVAEKGGTTADKHIAKRRWILVDIDPDRPHGIPSTTEEHKASRDMARRIRNDLNGAGFPEPIAIDSGNGTYLLYRADLPKDDDGLCERFLQGLSDRYSVPEVMKIDTTTFNPARIMRIPGTTNRKGDEVPDMDMEHRPCAILNVPDEIEIASRELLETIAVDKIETKAKAKTKTKSTTSNHDDGEQSWIKDWVRDHEDKLPSHRGWMPWDKGGEILVFDVCPFDASHDNASAYITVSPGGGGIAFGCHHDSCKCKGNNWRLLRDKIEGPRAHDVDVYYEPEPWPDIIKLGASAEDTPFPVDVLPEVFRDYVLSVASSRQVPVDLPSMLAIGMAAMACAKRYRVQIGNTHDEPLNLYIVGLLEPGERKSQTFRDFTFPADEVERLFVQRAQADIAMAKAQNAIYEERLKSLKRKAAKATSDEAAVLIADCAELQAMITPEPMAPAVMVGDVTPEFLSKAIADNFGRIAQVDAEGGTFFKAISGRYDKGGGGDFEIYLKAHSGDTHRSGRITRSGELIHNPALTLLMVGQPGLLHRIGNVEELIGRGLIGRMLFMFPVTKVGERTYADRPIDPVLRQRYEQAITAMLMEPIPEVEDQLLIRGDALEAWRKVHDDTEAAMRDGGELYHVRSWAQKYAGHVARIAALIHLMRGRPGDDISMDDVAGAARIGEYLKRHALSAFQIIGRRHDVLTGRVLAWIQRHHKGQFTVADCYRGLRRGEDVESSEDLMPAVDELERRGYVRLIPDNPLKSRGRPPSPTYEVNPSVIKVVDHE